MKPFLALATLVLATTCQANASFDKLHTLSAVPDSASVEATGNYLDVQKTKLAPELLSSCLAQMPEFQNSRLLFWTPDQHSFGYSVPEMLCPMVLDAQVDIDVKSPTDITFVSRTSEITGGKKFTLQLTKLPVTGLGDTWTVSRFGIGSMAIEATDAGSFLILHNTLTEVRNARTGVLNSMVSNTVKRE